MRKNPIDITKLSPSELITVALDDLLAVEKMKGYEIDMSYWHYPHHDACYVCLAGSVMVRGFGAKPNQTIEDFDFYKRPEIWARFGALDAFRLGEVQIGFYRMTPGLTSAEAYKKYGHLDRPITPYETDRRAFLRDMRKLARDLKAEGL